MTVRRNLIRVSIALVFGLLSAVGVNMFLVHANSYSSGLTGASQLVQALLKLAGINVSLSLLVAIFNIPLFIFAWRVFGTHYITFSGLAVLFNIIFLQIIPSYQLVTDPLTNTIVGGVLIGAGVGLCFNRGFTTGGIDIVTTYLQKKFHRNVGSIANIINGVILLITALVFGPSRIVYSLIGMLITNYTMDHFFSSQRDVIVSIYTKNPQAIADQLKDFAHGATIHQPTDHRRSNRDPPRTVPPHPPTRPHRRSVLLYRGGARRRRGRQLPPLHILSLRPFSL